MQIDLKCSQCGGNWFNLEAGQDDDARVDCAECGHLVGTMAELKERIAAEVLKHSQQPSAQP